MNEKERLQKVKQASSPASKLIVRLARNDEEIKAAQRLRYKVFAEELGADIKNGDEGLDTDRYDPYCLHLLAIDENRKKVIGTHRLLTPAGAKAGGGWYSASKFDLSPLSCLLSQTLEIGRACLDKEYRLGGGIICMWAGIASLIEELGLRYFMGCASISLADGGILASSVYHRLVEEKQLVEEKYRVISKNPFQLKDVQAAHKGELPTLIRGSLKLGAKISGLPCVDEEFGTAVLLVMGDFQATNQRFVKRIIQSYRLEIEDEV